MELWKGPSIIARETRIRHNVLDKGAAAAAQDRLTLSIQIIHQMANGKRDRFLMIALGTRGRRRYYNIFYVSINFFSMLFAPLCQFFFSHLISGTSQTLLMVGRTRRGKSVQHSAIEFDNDDGQSEQRARIYSQWQGKQRNCHSTKQI